nr:nuclear distribution protein nudE homolog 1-like isoform X4 [Cherax quadricarinatus]
MNGGMTFPSLQEEAAFWRKKAMEYKQSLEETREELEEFQSGSRELEAELEAQLEQTETRCSEYQSQLNRLALENDSLKESPVLIETRQTLSQWSI